MANQALRSPTVSLGDLFQTDTNGNATFERVPEGPVVIRIGYEDRPEASQTVSLVGGEEKTVGMVVKAR